MIDKIFGAIFGFFSFIFKFIYSVLKFVYDLFMDGWRDIFDTNKRNNHYKNLYTKTEPPKMDEWL